MEDAHAAVLNLMDDASVGPKERVSFFAVYDGHGGANVARYSGRTVHSRLLELPEFKEKQWEAALRRSFLKTDEDLRSGTFSVGFLLHQTLSMRTIHRAALLWLPSLFPKKVPRAAPFMSPMPATRAVFLVSPVRRKL